MIPQCSPAAAEQCQMPKDPKIRMVAQQPDSSCLDAAAKPTCPRSEHLRTLAAVAIATREVQNALLSSSNCEACDLLTILRVN